MGRFTGWVAWLEKRCAGCKPLAEIYGRPYRNVVGREMKMAGVGPEDMLLQVGCGAVPFSAIWAARLTGCRVLALDRDREAVDRARQVVKRLGLGIQVEIRQQDASWGVPPGFTAAHLALQARPKEQILRRIAQANPGVTVVVRQPRPGLEAAYDSPAPTWPLVARVEQNMGTFPYSLLLATGEDAGEAEHPGARNQRACEVEAV